MSEMKELKFEATHNGEQWEVRLVKKEGTYATIQEFGTDEMSARRRAFALALWLGCAFALIEE